jgi:hypothetical protein
MLRHAGSTYNLVYSKAYLKKCGAVPPAEIVGTSLLKDDLRR